MNQWCRSAFCGHPLPALTDNWTHGAASRYTIAPISYTRPSPHSRSYYSFPVPLRVGGWVGLNTQWVSNLFKVVCSGPGVSRTRNLSVTSPILYHYTTAPNRKLSWQYGLDSLWTRRYPDVTLIRDIVVVTQLDVTGWLNDALVDCETTRNYPSTIWLQRRMRQRRMQSKDAKHDRRRPTVVKDGRSDGQADTRNYRNWWSVIADQMDYNNKRLSGTALGKAQLPCE